MDLYDLIRTARPNLKENGIRSYVIILHKIYAGVKEPEDPDEIINLDWINDGSQILDWIDSQPFQDTTKKNYIQAVLVVIQAQPEKDEETIKLFREVIEKKQMKYYSSINEKSKKERKNWTTLAELRKVSNNIKKEIKKQGILAKTERSPYEKELLKDYVISLLYTLIPPRRLEYASVRVGGEGDNILNIRGKTKMNFVFKDYKTAGKFGTQKVECPPRLVKAIKDLQLKEGDSLLGLTENGLGKRIKKIFKMGDKEPTLNDIRHIWATENVDMEYEKKTASLAGAMAHSKSQQLNYTKKE